MFDPAEILESKNFNVEEPKIIRHRKEVSRLELALAQSDEGYFEVEVYLPDYKHTSFSVGKWESKEEAQREYEAMSEKIGKGEYKLHLYSNGVFEVEWL